MKTCENCGTEHDQSYGSGRFCSLKCARGFSTKAKRKEINEKVSDKLSGKIGSRGGICLKKFICQCCKKEYETNKIESKFCSKSCLRFFQNSLGWTEKQYEIDWSTIHRNAYKNGKNYVAGGTTNG